MLIMHGKREVRHWASNVRRGGRSLGFVPTMGYLHDGHIELVRRARRECDAVIASIFVNPLQFGPKEDLAAYPRDVERDTAQLKRESCDAVFVPDAEEMYEPQFATRVSVEGLSDVLCGRSRPGHFSGVATVVLKLLNIVTPSDAYFGLKDYQQYMVVKRMVEDLDLDVHIVGCETVRDHDGVALSSRNSYLTDAQRQQAAAIPAALQAAEALIKGGEREAEKVRATMSSVLQEKAPDGRIDYVEVSDARHLQPVTTLQPHEPVLVSLAFHLGRARLIDNRVVTP